MKRLGVLKAVWHLLVQLGVRPSRRTMQDMLGKTTGKKWATDEVARFLSAWQYRGEDGLFYLRQSLGPIEVQQRSKPGPAPGPEPVLKKPDLGPVESSTEVQDRSSYADLKTENPKEREIPPEPNGSVPPARGPTKRIVVTEDVPDVAFEPDDERRVAALVAERNPSGSIAPRVLRRFRGECKAKLVLVGAACWRYGVDTALAKPAGWQYAVSVMANNPLGPPPRPSSRGAPKERYVPENLRPSADKLAFYDQLGKGTHAIRQGNAVLDRQQSAGADSA